MKVIVAIPVITKRKSKSTTHSHHAQALILTIRAFSTLLPMRFWTRSAARLKTMTKSVVSRMKKMNIFLNGEGALRVLFYMFTLDVLRLNISLAKSSYMTKFLKFLLDFLRGLWYNS